MMEYRFVGIYKTTGGEFSSQWKPVDDMFELNKTYFNIVNWCHSIRIELRERKWRYAQSN